MMNVKKMHTRVNNMAKYELTQSKDPHGFIYGIKILTKDLRVVTYENISNQKNELEQLVNLCNDLDVDLCHIEDILDDFMTDFCI